MNRLTINQVAMAAALGLHVLLLTVQVGSKPLPYEQPTRIAIRLVESSQPAPLTVAQQKDLVRPITENDNHMQKRKVHDMPTADVVRPAQKTLSQPTETLPVVVATPVTPSTVAAPAPTPASTETVPVSAAAAPIASPAAPDTASRLSEYLLAIRSQVENHKDYPGFARQMRQQGTVLVRVAITPDGRLHEVVIVSSSGHASLDKAAVAAVRNAGRFRSSADFGLSGTVTIDIPISYKLI